MEYEGTYPLPEAQLDRFLMRVSFGYPTGAEEADILRRRIARRQEEQTLDPVTDAGTLVAMQDAVETVTVEDSITEYCVALAAATRSHAHVLVGSSPRGSLALDADVARVRGHRRPRLRDAGGRQGGRAAGPRPPGDRKPGALDEQRVGREPWSVMC